MDPSLPGDDRDGEARQRKLERARRAYCWSCEYPSGIPLVERVPVRDRYSISFLAQVLQLNIEVGTNHAASKFAELFDDDDDDSEDALLERFVEAPAQLLARVFGPPSIAQAGRTPVALAGLDDYFDMFATLDPPPIVETWRRGPAQRDLAFAWQRMAGPNPMILRRATELPGHFPVDDALYRRVAGEGGRTDSLDAALAEGRLYLADYAALDGIPNGCMSDGRTKYVWAPIALFALVPGRGALVPVAIQCGQRPDRDTPLWTPADGWRWEMAKTVVQVADGNHHQAVVHLAYTHLVLEPFIIAAHRQLSERHPLHILLDPHFEFTLSINDTAAKNLVAVGGEVEEVLGGTLDGSLSTTKAALARFRLADMLPGADLRRRGLDDRDALPIMPYRDDTLQIWAAIRDWVGAYLDRYYRDDATVSADPELQAWIREIASADGGRLPGVGSVETTAQLLDVVSFVIWTASAQHSAVNFPQYDFMGFVPNMPGAGYAPAPGPDTPDTEQAWLDMLTPIGGAILQCDTVYQLANIRKNRLGDYGRFYFDDRAVRPLVATFQAALDEIERNIEARERQRFMPYPYLLPSNVTASIHI